MSRRLQLYLSWCCILGVLCLTLAVGIWFGLPRWAPAFTLKYSPWPDPALRAARVSLRTQFNNDLNAFGFAHKADFKKFGLALWPGLIDGLDSEDRDWSRACLYFLAWMPEGPQQIAAMLALSHSTQHSPDARAVGVLFCHWQEVPNARDLLRTLLCDPAEPVRWAAVNACAYLPADSANTDQYLHILNDPRPDAYDGTFELSDLTRARCVAIHCLGKLNHPRVDAALRAYVARSRLDQMQAEAINAIASTWSPDAEQFLRDQLRSDRGPYVLTASLQQLQRHRACVPLGALLPLINSRTCSGQAAAGDYDYFNLVNAIYTALDFSNDPAAISILLHDPLGQKTLALQSLGSLLSTCPRPWPIDAIRSALHSQNENLLRRALCAAAWSHDLSLLPDLEACATQPMLATELLATRAVLQGTSQNLDDVDVLDDGGANLIAFLALYAHDPASQHAVQQCMQGVMIMELDLPQIGLVQNFAMRLAMGTLSAGDIADNNNVAERNGDAWLSHWPLPQHFIVSPEQRRLAARALAANPLVNQQQLGQLATDPDPAIAAIAQAVLPHRHPQPSPP